MKFAGLFLLLLMFGLTIADDVQSPRIIIVGAGVSGIAAASALFEKGFDNVTLLEAENRIGGRIFTDQLGNYLIDIGAQWIHGQINNAVYEKVAPLGLVENSSSSLKTDFMNMYFENGEALDRNIIMGINEHFLNIIFDKNITADNRSLGEIVDSRLAEYFNEHPEINETVQDSVKWLVERNTLTLDPADSWYDIGIDPNYETCEGDFQVNWKDKGYSTFLDVLMKKVPDSTEELPVISNTILNSEVVTIDHTADDGTVKVITTDGREFIADHVIVTVSLGVLKEKYETMFQPPLPQSKIDNIMETPYGSVVKVFLMFEEPWWSGESDTSGFGFLLTKDEREEIRNSHPDRKWVLDLVGYFFVEHKPNLLQVWLTGETAREIDKLSDTEVTNQLMTHLRTHMSDRYNITDPVAMKRSKWYSNPHFRGTYSSTSVIATELKLSREELAAPILKEEKPVICFAGEATSKDHYSTVHGATETGWREAGRLSSLYPDIKAANKKPTS